jgi:hypothetical protein
MATKTTNTRKKAAKPAANEAAQNDSKLKEFFVDELKDIYWACLLYHLTLPTILLV